MKSGGEEEEEEEEEDGLEVGRMLGEISVYLGYVLRRLLPERREVKFHE